MLLSEQVTNVCLCLPSSSYTCDVLSKKKMHHFHIFLSNKYKGITFQKRGLVNHLSIFFNMFFLSLDFNFRFFISSIFIFVVSYSCSESLSEVPYQFYIDLVIRLLNCPTQISGVLFSQVVHLYKTSL